jgi:hypothetical protein
MSATKSSLTSRWKTPAGKVAVRAIANALRAGTSVDELKGYVKGLPGVDEVAPALDLRGIALPELVAARKSDLSGARFDGARLNWVFGGSILNGAVFDRAEGRNVDFGGCELARSSFRDANLPGAIFFSAKLPDANLAGIKLRSGQLKAADCRRARFEGADLRLVWAADADLRGADLTKAQLVGASLGGAKWDEATRCADAEFGVEGTPAALAAHALAQGARLRSEKPDWELALLDATSAALRSEDRAGNLEAPLRRLTEVRPQVKRDHTFNWFAAVQEVATAEQRALLQGAVRKAASNIGALLG